MDRTKRDLEDVIASQKEQLNRYEKRLKDVVTAYKGLLKEKEALETSLAAISAKGKESQSHNPDLDAVDNRENDGKASQTVDVIDERNNMETQIMTLMNSLATLSAEKSRMEASFQADKKQLRSQLAQKDRNIIDLQHKIKENEERAKADVDEIKAKWIIERQEREKETNNQILMIRELQKLYADERHLKENIEMQLNNFKTQFASNEAENNSLRELQIQLKEAKTQLKQLQTTNKNVVSSEEIEDSSVVLRQVRQEMQQLKEQHAVAIKNEQMRVVVAEEESRKQAALHEDRVVNLEARLAELSNTVGTYDRLRQQDQENILLLKQKLQLLERTTSESANTVIGGFSSFINSESKQRFRQNGVSTNDNLEAIVDEIMNLKKLLLSENTRATNPIDVNKIFSPGCDHVQCQEELNHVVQQCEGQRLQIIDLEEKLQIQKTHIATLQEKVKVLNRNIDEQENELRQQGEKLRQTLKVERVKFKNAQAEMETEYRCKINDLEQQLQKQRQRSLQLLDEKEQEIKTIQTSFEIFHSGSNVANATMPLAISEMNAGAASSDAESNDGGGTNDPPKTKLKVNSKKLSVGENCHMLHYANELARKDIEIASLRKAKYIAETSMRKAIQDKVSAQEELGDKISALKEQVDRLERCKTREGANLEYLKNVIISYIVSKDTDGKRHMMNAISAVLQFTPTETQIINAAFHKK